MNLPEDDQRHGEVVALIERPIDFDGLLRRRNTLGRAAIGKGAAGNREIGKKPRLEAEIADTGGDLQSAPADPDGVGRIDDGVENTEIGLGAARRTLQIGLFSDR